MCERREMCEGKYVCERITCASACVNLAKF